MQHFVTLKAHFHPSVECPKDSNTQISLNIANYSLSESIVNERKEIYEIDSTNPDRMENISSKIRPNDIFYQKKNWKI